LNHLLSNDINETKKISKGYIIYFNQKSGDEPVIVTVQQQEENRLHQRKQEITQLSEHIDQTESRAARKT